jgi:hypothetical protein
MSIMGVDKQVLGTWAGLKDRINIGLDEGLMDTLKQAKPASLIVARTHPKNSFFSPDDLSLLLKYPTIESVVVQCLDGSRYTMRIPPGAFRIPERLEDQYGKFEKELARLVLPSDAALRQKLLQELYFEFAKKMRWEFEAFPLMEVKRNMSERELKPIEEWESLEDFEKWKEWGRNELGGIEFEYNPEEAARVVEAMGKDVEAFKRLSLEEQDRVYDELNALSDEKCNEIWDKVYELEKRDGLWG